MNSYETVTEEGTPYKFQAMASSLHTAHELYHVAEFMDRDLDLWVFRRFGTLQIFNILSMQQRLKTLEGEFRRRMSSKPPLCCNDLVPDIQHTLKEYNDALAAQAKFRSYLKPEARVLEHMEDWSRKQEPALRNGLADQDNNRSTKDIAAIAAIEKTWVHRFIDRHRRLHSLFEEKKDPKRGVRSTMIYYEKGVLRAETAFLHMSFCALLLCPIITMLYVEKTVWKLIVTAVFLLVVSVLSVGLLSTSNNAGLALVAGYAAILVVFLSNNVGSCCV